LAVLFGTEKSEQTFTQEDFEIALKKARRKIMPKGNARK